MKSPIFVVVGILIGVAIGWLWGASYPAVPVHHLPAVQTNEKEK